MRTTIPANPHRAYTLIAGLDVTGMFFVGAGALLGYSLIVKPWPFLAKLPVALLLVGAGAALGWGRWPLGEAGDPVGHWLRRAGRYFVEEMPVRRFWAWPTAPKSAPHPHKPGVGRNPGATASAVVEEHGGKPPRKVQRKETS